ncbi:glycosyltransferase family 39 protein [Pseudomonas tructae]|uniref:Glycosyltransferase family 39 protein n=1 Tax=Pseudomonas tructae TaxID=2518644 RepID=A0A411MH04_9PSED|nr:glycosyltransferase family 39 protein [Pseudomonas tructae]QBF26087.1 glycosyltransferase family 39 protein [Pseudomonas tructae]
MTAARRERWLWLLLGAIVLVRLLALGSYPLMDTSEARYAEMARKMVESGDWVTPMFDHDVPFWGKPPLSFWTQAASMHLLGVNEFAARLPAWLLHLASCLLILHLGWRERSLQVGLWAAIIYSSSGLGLLASGVVLTDPALALALLLALYGFWHGMQHADARRARLGFVGLGLGLLAKGPLVLPLVGLVALSWTLIHRQWHRFWRLPWLSGLGLMTLIAIPWYVLAELKTPGFLDYFLLGEHWNRFVDSGWAGDLYGNAHAKPPATIWLYLGYALLPWSLWLPVLWWGRQGRDRFTTFVWAWALATPVFFTLAGNILWTYVLPSLPAWSLLLASAMVREQQRWMTLAFVSALSLPLLAVLITSLGSLGERVQNQREIVSAWQQAQAVEAGPLLYPGRRSYSAEFYSDGQARRVRKADEYPQAGTFYLARRIRDLADPLPLELRCELQLEVNASRLLRCQRVADTLIWDAPTVLR